MAQEISLTNGPSNMGLMFSLFDTELRDPRAARFETAVGDLFIVIVDGATKEGGSERVSVYSWLITGHEVSGRRWIPISARFNTQVRRGRIKMLKNDPGSTELHRFFGSSPTKSNSVTHEHCPSCHRDIAGKYPCKHCGDTGVVLTFK